MAKLLKLNQQVQTCRLCRLCRTRINGVPGEGNENAEIMFIGEGPGFNEDREGRPFVGQAGTFLEELLSVAGLTREQVYITNVVKCRPPQNRDPLPDEIEACAPYLERQMALIDPLVIVTLGRYSMFRFFPNDRITSVAGQARYNEGRMIVTMLHPAYALRNVEAKDQMRDAFRKLPAIVEQARSARANKQVEASQPVDEAAFAAALDQRLNEIEQKLKQDAEARKAAALPVVVAAQPENPFAYANGVKEARKAGKTTRKTAPKAPAQDQAAPASVNIVEDVIANEPAPVSVSEQFAPVTETQAPKIAQAETAATVYNSEPEAVVVAEANADYAGEQPTDIVIIAPQAETPESVAAQDVVIIVAPEQIVNEEPVAVAEAAPDSQPEAIIFAPEALTAITVESAPAEEPAATPAEPTPTAAAKGKKKGKQEPPATQMSLF